MDNNETYSLSCIGGDDCRASTMMKKHEKRVKNPMSDEHKQILAKSREDRKKHRKNNFTFLDLGDIRIVRIDDINLAVELKQKNVWKLMGYYGSPLSAIVRVINLSIDVNHKLALNEFVHRFHEVSDTLTELVSGQARQFEHDADAKYAKVGGGKK